MTERLFNYQQKPRPFGMKTRRLNAVTGILLAIFSVMFFSQGTWAQGTGASDIQYVTYNSGKFELATAHSGTYERLTGNSAPTLQDGKTYVLTNDNINSRLIVNGTVNIILCDGVTFTAQKGIHVSGDDVLNIYAQSGGTGKLIAKGCSENNLSYAAIGGGNSGLSHNTTYSHYGHVNIYGGQITADASSIANAPGIGGFVSPSLCCDVTCYAGSVEAMGGTNAYGIVNLKLGEGVTYYGGNSANPITPLAEGPQTSAITCYQYMNAMENIYNLTVGGTQVRTTNISDILFSGGTTPTASFDASSNTLKLNGLQLDGNIVSGAFPLTIELSGTNIINTTSGFASCIQFYTLARSGSGSVTLTKGIEGASLTLTAPSGVSVISAFDDVVYTDFVLLEDGAYYDTSKNLFVDASNSALETANFVTASAMAPPTISFVNDELVLSCTSSAGTLKYDLTYADGNGSVTDQTYDSNNKPQITRPATVTAYVSVNGTKGNSVTGKYFGFSDDVMVDYNGSNAALTVPTLKPDIESTDGVTITYSSSNSNVVQTSASGLTVNGLGSATVEATFNTTTSTSVTVLNPNNKASFKVTAVPTAPTISFNPSKQYTNNDVLEISTIGGASVLYTWDNTVALNKGDVVDLTKAPALNLYSANQKPSVQTGTVKAWAAYSQNGQYLVGGETSQAFSVKQDISKYYVADIENMDYTGKALQPTITVKPTETGTALVNGTDYTVSYKQQDGTTVNSLVNAGTYQVIISGMGDYVGTIDSKTFTITKATPTVTAPTGLSLTYNGSAQALANAGSTTAGTLLYSIDNQTYSTSIPSATNAGTYTVYYLVVGDANNNDVAAKSVTATIAKGAATISFASAQVNKTFGDAAFTNALENKGDGKVTYSSSNTAVATVDANGKVTIVGSGDATITATVADGTNYTYATKTASYQLKVGTAALSGVTATGYTGAYDAKAHGISVTAPDGATVKYGTVAGTYNLTASPTYTNAGTYTVYYQVTKANFTTVTGSQTVTISKAAATIGFASAQVNKTFGDAAFTNTLENKGDGKITGYNSSNTAVATVDANGKVTIVGSGDATITATVADGTNYTYATKTVSYQLKVGTAALSGVTATGYTGAYDAKAHGISVTAPDGATVKYGTVAGTYNLTASPTYTNAGTYTVYYQVTKANFTTVTGSQTVTISKAAATIGFASAQVNKTFGDAAFTNALENKGDGKITGYNSSNTAVATVDANGKVTIVGSGNATITATVADGTNYTYATKTASYQLKVGTATLSGVTATGYTGAYDAKAHGISVTAPDGATVKYGTVAGTYNLTASPTYTNAGTYTVYYQVTKANFTTLTGSKTVTITKANAQVLYVDYVFTTKIGETFNPPYLTLNPVNLAVTYSSSDDEIATVDAQTGEVTLVSPGEVKIYAYFAGDANYNSAYDYYILTVLQRDIDPIDKDVVYLMDDEYFLYTDEDGNTQEYKLDNTIIFDILFTLNIDGDPSESDGYDETEHCIVLNHHMYDSRLYNLIFMGVEPGSKEYAEEYTGLTFKVPAGTGYIIIDSRTDGEHWMKVQIGDLAPVSFCHTDREKDYILYECEKDTWVHVYNGGLVSDVSMAPFHRAKKTKGHVMIYSITRKSSAPAGIERISSDVLESDRWYDLQGNKIQRPTKKGLYILDGQKVIVR